MWIIIIIAALVALVVYFVGKRPMASGWRGAALSSFARRYDLEEARLVHDYVLKVHLNARLHGWQMKGFRDGEYFIMTIEAVAALRMRVEDLEGRAHGASYRYKYGMALERASKSLEAHSSLEDVSVIEAAFAITAEPISPEFYSWLGYQQAALVYVFLYPNNVPSERETTPLKM